MIGLGGNTDATKTTSYKVVLPFYGYASIAFFIATALLFLSINNIATHYFHPHSSPLPEALTFFTPVLVRVKLPHLSPDCAPFGVAVRVKVAPSDTAAIS